MLRLPGMKCLVPYYIYSHENSVACEGSDACGNGLVQAQLIGNIYQGQ